MSVKPPCDRPGRSPAAPDVPRQQGSAPSTGVTNFAAGALVANAYQSASHMPGESRSVCRATEKSAPCRSCSGPQCIQSLPCEVRVATNSLTAEQSCRRCAHALAAVPASATSLAARIGAVVKRGGTISGQHVTRAKKSRFPTCSVRGGRIRIGLGGGCERCVAEYHASRFWRGDR